jgi:hypothetical protein
VTAKANHFQGEAMVLNGVEILRCQSLVKPAFPQFADWQYMNERNDSYAGFCIWGRHRIEQEDLQSPKLFVTFATSGEKWSGHLTVGKHCYYWSSTEEGDAYLLDTKKCDTLEAAIASLKKQIDSFIAALVAVEPG